MKPEQVKTQEQLEAVQRDLWSSFPFTIHEEKSLTHPFRLELENSKGHLLVPVCTGNSKCCYLSYPGRKQMSQFIAKVDHLYMLIPALHQHKALVNGIKTTLGGLGPLQNTNTEANIGLEFPDWEGKIWLSADYDDPRWIVRSERKENQQKAFPFIRDPRMLPLRADDMLRAMATMSGITVPIKLFDPFDL